MTSLILIVLLIVIVLPPLRTTIFENRLLQQIDQAATERVEESLGRALASFALARLSKYSPAKPGALIVNRSKRWIQTMGRLKAAI